MGAISKRELVHTILNCLPLRLKREDFVYTYNKAKALYSHRLQNDLPKIEGVSRDEMILCLSTIFKDRFIAHKLVPVYLFYSEPLLCLQWLKSNLKGVSRLQSDLMKDGMLQMLHKFNLDDFKEAESDMYYGEIGFLINELHTFDYDNTDAPPLDANTSWEVFFYDSPQFVNVVTARQFAELLRDVYDKLSIDFIAPDDVLKKACLEDKLPLLLLRDVPEKLYYHQPIFEDTDSLPEDLLKLDVKNPEHTMPRKLLAIYYLFEYLRVRQVDKKSISRFIEFLTGHNEKNIYVALDDPLTTKKGNYRIEDMEYIRTFFEKLKLKEIVKLIDNDLEKFTD